MIFDATLALETDRAYRTVDIERQRQRTCAALQLTDNQRVVDIGCGSGLLLEELAEQVGPGGEAVGIDSSPEMLALARQRCDSLPQVVLTEGTTSDLAGYSGHFDAASCVQVLLYIDDVPLALEQIHRSLRPDGRLVIVETDWRGALLSGDDAALSTRIFNAWDAAVANPHLPNRLLPMLRAQGFSPIEVAALPIINTRLTPDTFSFETIRRLAHNAVESGAVGTAAAESWQEGLHRQSRDGSYFFSVNRFLFTASRP